MKLHEVHGMNIQAERVLESIIESLSKMEYVKSSEIPNIDLYMDQVLTFMNGHLEDAKRYENDKIMTKTMINNYAKNDLLPPPNKKKYSKEHLMVLTFIYYFKGILSIKDIETLLCPITERYFHTDNALDITRIYDEVCAHDKERTKILQDDIQALFQASSETFSDVTGDDKEFLQFFSLICMLSLDVYVKKMLIEKLIDLVPPNKDNKKK